MSIAQKMTELIAEIGAKLTDNDSVTFETCDAAHFGWDAEKHHAMHALARHGVPDKNWRIQHRVQHGVTDWTIIDEDKLKAALQGVS